MANASQDSVFSVASPEAPSWAEAYAALPDDRRDPFYSPGFAKAAAGHLYPDHDVLCAVWRGGNGLTALYPFVLRRLAKVIGVEDVPGDPRDMTGLYGRSGVLHNASDGPALAPFQQALRDWAGRHGVLCAFDRFHPILPTEVGMPPGCQIVETGVFVVADLSPPWEGILKKFSSGQRAAIKQSQRLGCKARVANDAAAIQEFADVYRETMDARSAADVYYFPTEFFRALRRELGDGMQIVLVEHEGRVVSACLLLLDGSFCHYYLAGTARDALKLRASQLAQATAMSYARDRGCRYYLLGGGQKTDDGLVRYKLSFAPDGARPSRIGFTVFDEEGLASLRSWMTARKFPIGNRFQFFDTAS